MTEEAIRVIKEKGLEIIDITHAISVNPDTQILKGPDELQ